MKRNLIFISSLCTIAVTAQAADYFVVIPNSAKIVAPALNVQLLDFAFPSFRPGLKQSFDISSLVYVTGDGSYTSNDLTWSAVNLPSGFAISNNYLTGQAATVGNASFTLSASYKGVTGSKNYVFNVAGAPVLSDVVSASSAAFHACAVTGNGNLYCWGANSPTYSLGNGSTDMGYITNKPISIYTGEPMASVSSSRQYNTCAVAKSGSVWCWGANNNAQLGQGVSSGVINYPIKVNNVTNAIQVAVSSSHGCAVTSDGRLMCWGANPNGQLFDASKKHATNKYAPAYADLSMLFGSEKVLQVVVDDLTTCIRTDLGRVFCAGGNNFGQLGQGYTITYDAGVQVSGMDSGVTDIAGGYQKFCAVKGGQAYCWGNKASISGGAFVLTNSLPVLQPGLSNITSLAFLASNVFCAVSNNNAYCWGDNSSSVKFFPASPTVVQSPGNLIAANVGPDFKFPKANNGYVACYITKGNLRCAGAPGDTTAGALGVMGDGTSINKGFETMDYVIAP